MKFLSIVLISLTLLPAGWAWAQTDSLQQAVEGHLQADTARVNLLNILAKSILDDGPRINQLATEALALSHQLDYPTGEAFALNNLGIAARLLGHHPQALRYLRQGLAIAQRIPDSARMTRLHFDIAYVYYHSGEPLKAFADCRKSLELAQASQSLSQIQIAFALLGTLYEKTGDYPRALENKLQSERTAEKLGDKKTIARSALDVGNTYNYLGDYPRALESFTRALRVFETLKGQEFNRANVINSIGETYRLQKKYQQALPFYQRAFQYFKAKNIEIGLLIVGTNLADINEKQGHFTAAFRLGKEVLAINRKINNVEAEANASGTLARVFLRTQRPDSAVVYAKKSLIIARQNRLNEYARDASQTLAQATAALKNYPEAYRYQTLYTAYRDSLSNDDATRRLALLQYNYDLEKKQAQIALLTKNNQLQQEAVTRRNQLLLALLLGLGLALGLAGVLVRSNRHQKRTNAELTRLNETLALHETELAARHHDLQKTLAELKATQAQLIQREKLISLGELTAGIAHEIQNPLNFVANFSEVSSELIQELRDEKKKVPAERDEAAEAELVADLEQNLQKISLHSQRAAGIVRGMLEHARPTSHERQVANVNALVEEYLRISYGALRAKNPDIRVDLHTDFGPDVSEIEVVPQDLGRVFLNLFNNAFYAVSEKKKTASNGYQPTVWVQTGKVPSGGWKASVRDNGMGIPEAIQSKIFQPFFTTKPAGQGTGLGLSLAYDIVVKGHGGSLAVASTVGEATEFVLTLNASNHPRDLVGERF